MKIAQIDSDGNVILIGFAPEGTTPPTGWYQIVDTPLRTPTRTQKLVHIRYEFDEQQHVVKDIQDVEDLTAEELAAVVNKEKQIKKDYLKKYYNALLEDDSNVYYVSEVIPNTKVNFGERSLSRLGTLLSLYSPTDSLEFRTFENTMITITGDVLRDLYTEMTSKRQALLTEYWSKLQQVDVATTLEELDAIVVSTQIVERKQSFILQP